MFYINFRTNNLDTFTLIEVESYKLAKENYKRIVDSGFVNVSLSDYEGEVLLDSDKSI